MTCTFMHCTSMQCTFLNQPFSFLVTEKLIILKNFKKFITLYKKSIKININIINIIINK